MPNCRPKANLSNCSSFLITKVEFSAMSNILEMTERCISNNCSNWKCWNNVLLHSSMRKGSHREGDGCAIWSMSTNLAQAIVLNRKLIKSNLGKFCSFFKLNVTHAFPLCINNSKQYTDKPTNCCVAKINFRNFHGDTHKVTLGLQKAFAA